MSELVLALKDVSCQFGRVSALNSVSLAVKAGERIALVGPSGAGKSTLIALLNVSLSPTSGEMSVLGHSLHSLTGRRRRRLQQQIVTVYQQHQLIDNLSEIHNINAGRLGQWPLWKAMWSLVWPLEIKNAQQALEQLGIADKLYARTDRLSGGQQQRVALARILVQDPAIVLADEPVASVDPARAHDMMRLLCEVADKNGTHVSSETNVSGAKTLLVSLHTVALAKQYCDRIIGLRQGQLNIAEPEASIRDQQLAALYDLPATAA